MSPHTHKPESKKSAWRKWTTVTGIGTIALVVSVWPQLSAGGNYLWLWFRAPSVLKKHEAQISTVEKTEQVITNGQMVFEAKLYQRLKDMDAKLDRIENRLDYHGAYLPPVAAVNTNFYDDTP